MLYMPSAPGPRHTVTITEKSYEVRVFMYMSSAEGPRHTDIITE